MKVKSAQYQRNGVTGRSFYAGIVTDPFGVPGSKGQDFLIVSLDNDENRVAEVPSVEETFVISMSDLRAGELNEKWRGDNVSLKTLAAIRKAADS
jgi:hypothetical protein